MKSLNALTSSMKLAGGNTPPVLEDVQMSHIAILGNGPSLKGVDLTRFRRVPTIGMNAAYRHWDRIGWYPTIYCCLDDRVVVSHQKEILRLIHDGRCEVFFLHPNILRTYPGLAGRDNVFLLPSFETRYAIYWKLCADLRIPALDPYFFCSARSEKVTTGVMSVRFAAFLGFTEMLLLGIDARYQQIVEGAAQREGIALEMERTPEKNPNYFFDDYQREGDLYNLPTPTSYDGNMHADVFAALKEDWAERAPQIRIAVGTEESELFSQGLFPYRSVDGFLSAASADRFEIHKRKSDPQPAWVPQASGLSYGGLYMQKGVARINERQFLWSSAADAEAWLCFLFGGARGVRPGARLAAAATLTADRDCTVVLRICRHGETPYEGQERRLPLKAGNATSTESVASLWRGHEGARFAIRVAECQSWPATIAVESVSMQLTRTTEPGAASEHLTE